MLYLFIFIFQLLGIGFHVGQKAIEIDKRTPGDTLKDVFGIFLRENLITLIMSGLVLILDLCFHAALDVYTLIPDKPVDIFELFTLPYEIVAILSSFLLGYAGQRLIYKLLGKAEGVIEKKLEDKLSK